MPGCSTKRPRTRAQFSIGESVKVTSGPLSGTNASTTNFNQAWGSDLDFGPIVTRIAGLNPDFVVLSTTDKGAVGVLKEMKRTQSKAAILITGIVSLGDLALARDPKSALGDISAAPPNT